MHHQNHVQDRIWLARTNKGILLVLLHKNTIKWSSALKNEQVI